MASEKGEEEFGLIMDPTPVQRPRATRVWDDVPEARRRVMAANRGKDTRPELLVRSLVHGMGYRYRLHRRDLPGKPDLSFPSRRKVIEVRGCFWHQHEGCPRATMPRTRSDFWLAKFTRNRERDRENEVALKALGWEVLVIWECEAARADDLATIVAAFLGPREYEGRVSSLARQER